jgi:hypothetical protein
VGNKGGHQAPNVKLYYCRSEEEKGRKWEREREKEKTVKERERESRKTVWRWWRIQKI